MKTAVNNHHYTWMLLSAFGGDKYRRAYKKAISKKPSNYNPGKRNSNKKFFGRKYK